MGDRPPSAVLFACTMNSIRSVMAEALFKRRFGARAYVASCGVRKGELDPLMLQVMEDVGIDISKHRPQTFDELDDDNFDLIVTLSPEAHHMAMELTGHLSVDVEYWPTFDPSIAEGSRDQRLVSYSEVRNELDKKIKMRFEALKP